MKIRHRWARLIVGLLCLASVSFFSGCVADEGYAYAGTAYVNDPPGPGIAITTDSDFYGPLSPYGRWVMVAGYGQCWVPNGVGTDWEPYEDGQWVATNDGWYWYSFEPWGWATCHYGRWIYDDEFGWCWIPSIEWGPAWVSWCEVGDDVGWAPLAPAGGLGWRAWFGLRRRRDWRRHYVFVHRRDFFDPVHPSAVARSAVVNQDRERLAPGFRGDRQGPDLTEVERAAGRRVQVRDLRRPSENEMQSRHAAPGFREGQPRPATNRDDHTTGLRPRGEKRPLEPRDRHEAIAGSARSDLRQSEIGGRADHSWTENRSIGRPPPPEEAPTLHRAMPTRPNEGRAQASVPAEQSRVKERHNRPEREQHKHRGDDSAHPDRQREERHPQNP